MPIEQQVCSLELAKRLKELGVKQESYFWWRNDYPKNPKKYENRWYLIPDTEYPITGIHKGVSYGGEDHLLAAFTVAELGEMLKESCDGVSYGFCHGTTDWHWWNKEEDDYEQAYTEADARAKMLIHLLENKLITL